MDRKTINSPLPSTVGEIVGDNPKFRILVLGKTGCGKSSLINSVFNVDIAQISDNTPGESDINFAFYPKDNDRFIVHDSQGFEPGEDHKLQLVKDFIEERCELSLPKQERLHAVWICITTPGSNDRAIETATEEVLKMTRVRVPVIVVFTKYDALVFSKYQASRSTARNAQTQSIARCEEIAASTFEQLCIQPLQKIDEKIPVEKVSVKPKFKATISQLIKTTDEYVRHIYAGSHVDPVPLSWAVAQRGSVDLNITTSIEVGRKKYWSGLLSKTDFTGQKLMQCLNTIHGDVITVWNIHDPEKCLAGDNFKALMSNLVKDLADPSTTNPSTKSSNKTLTVATSLASAASSLFGIAVASIGASIPYAKWVDDVYGYTPANVRCVMGYIIDLTIVMDELFLRTRDVSEAHVASVLGSYVNKDQVRIHDAIRRFVETTEDWRFGDTDFVLQEIIKMINEYHADPR